MNSARHGFVHVHVAARIPGGGVRVSIPSGTRVMPNPATDVSFKWLDLDLHR